MIFIGVGSSIGDAEKIFREAAVFLAGRGVQVMKKSSTLKNPPLGGVAKNEFANAVWQIEVPEGMEPARLLEILKQAEKNAGRDLAAPRWSDRELDLDILLWGEEILDLPGLKIPHPEITKRDFVMKPLSELVDESFKIPTIGPLNSFLHDHRKRHS